MDTEESRAQAGGRVKELLVRLAVMANNARSVRWAMPGMTVVMTKSIVIHIQRCVGLDNLGQLRRIDNTIMGLPLEIIGDENSPMEWYIRIDKGELK